MAGGRGRGDRNTKENLGISEQVVTGRRFETGYSEHNTRPTTTQPMLWFHWLTKLNAE
jgi:hypothetical protein